MSLTPVELRAGFDAFIEAAGKLQGSYSDLRARAEAVDLELRETNRRLEQALAERDAIFSALPLGVVARRRGGEVAFHNDEAQRLCALADENDVDLPMAATGDVAVGEGVVRVRRVDLPDGDLVLLEDRSQIHELEREVHRLDKLAGLSELALGVAHEIKNPLNGAMGFASLLQRADSLDTAQRHAGRVCEGLGQVDSIVKSLLAFARPDERQTAAATVASAVTEAAAAAEMPSSRIKIHGDKSLRAEANALQRVLAVLLRNAREANPGDVHVAIESRSVGGELELVVQDDGPGIAAELADRVFTPFVSSKPRGTGLGLPLAARVLSFLGGDVSLTNPGEPGARFVVRMPLVSGRAAGTVKAPTRSAEAQR